MLQTVSEGRATTDLLRSVAEQLKVPLTVIARQAELARLVNQFDERHATATQSQARFALTLVDSYLLGLQLLSEQGQLALEPVSVPSTLLDVAHELDQAAQQHQVVLELALDGTFAPVMAHARGLRAALLSLGYAFIEGQADDGHKQRLTLAVHRTPHGVVAGMYGNYHQFDAAKWHAALGLYGRATQPLPLVSSSGAGFFVADTILRSMETRLRVGRHQKIVGLATTLQPSQQLSFV